MRYVILYIFLTQWGVALKIGSCICKRSLLNVAKTSPSGMTSTHVPEAVETYSGFLIPRCIICRLNLPIPNSNKFLLTITITPPSLIHGQFIFFILFFFLILCLPCSVFSVWRFQVIHTNARDFEGIIYSTPVNYSYHYHLYK